MIIGIFWVAFSAYKEPQIISLKTTENGDLSDGDIEASLISHRDLWPVVSAPYPKEIRRRAWNYFPRGRVVAQGKKTIVYCHPYLCSRQDVRAIICHTFYLLQEQNIRFVADGSAHYRCLYWADD